MTAPRLPQVVAWLLHRVVPAPRSADVLADLAEDYAAARLARTRGGAALWLVREAASVISAYVRARGRPRFSPSMLARDLRSAVRGLRRAPVASAAAAAMLATGLLAILITAGLTETLLFRPVSRAHPDTLRRLTSVDRQGRVLQRFSLVELRSIGDRVGGAATLSSVTLQPVVLRVDNLAAQSLAEVVDGGYFALTGMTLRLGRGLMRPDDDPAAAPVAVVSEPYWRNQLGGSPTTLGRSIDLNGAAFTIVGVAATRGSSGFLGASVDAWIPMAHGDAVLARGWRTNPAERAFTAYLLPHRDLPEVEVALATATSALGRDLAEPWRDRQLQTTSAAALVGTQRTSAVLLASVLASLSTLILITAVSNLSGVILARAAAARRQVAIHLALGSGRAVILRRQLAEGALLGLCGGALALAGYAWARTLLAEVALLPTLALRLDLPLDARLALLVGIAGLAAGMALAAGPGLWASRVPVIDAIRDGDLRSGHRHLTRARRGLVAAQVAVAVALVVAATLFSRTLSALTSADLGFPRARLVALDFDLEPAGPPAAALPQLARDALERAARVPGILAVAMSNRAPVDSSTPAVDVRSVARGTVVAGDVTFNLVTPDYFETVGVPLVAGRRFTAAESASRAAVAIVNASLAAMLWPNADALERELFLGDEDVPVRIVGIARDAKYRTITESARPHLYRPTPPALGLTLLARAAGDPRASLRALQESLDAVGPGLVGFFPRTLDDHLAIELLPARAVVGAATIVGGIALVLSGIGLFGLISWFVAQRQREIGIRLALGANARDIQRLVAGEACRAALPGAIAGAMLAVLLALVARASLYGVGPLDPVALGAGALALVVVVLVAALGLTRRATRLAPADVLRSQ